VRIRFVVATSIAALAAVACSSVVNGKGSAGPAVPGPSTVSSGAPTVGPSITFPASSPAVPSASITFPAPSTPVISSALPTLSPPPSTQQADYKCPDIVMPATHLSFVCVAQNMKKNTKAKPWPIVWQEVVAHYPNGGKWTLDTGAGHWGSQGSDSLRAIATAMRDRMVSLGEYGNPAPTLQTTGQHIQITGHPAYQLQTTFTINPQFRQQYGVPIKHEKSWILAIEVAPNDVSLWYVSVPDAVSYYWPLIDTLIGTISVN
jgi:hypothetical protein